MNGTSGEITYLDTACMGLVPKEVSEEIKGLLGKMECISTSPTQFTVDLYGNLESARNAAARLLNVNKEEIAIVESTTHGLGLIAGGIPIEAKNNVVISDIEFFATTLCWRKRQQKTGFEIRQVRTTGGKVRACDFEKYMDENTKIIVLSSVQEINGFRADLKEIGRLAKQNDCYLIVDGIQEAGALNVNLSDLDVDIYCSGGHKWLRNPFGTGFLYVNKRIIDRIEPDFYGYFNLMEPSGGWQNYLESPGRTPFDNLAVNPTAQKFEIGGTANYLGAFGLYKNIELILKKGIDNIENSVRELNKYLVKGLRDLNLHIGSSTDDKSSSGIVCFNLPGGLAQEKELTEELARNQIFISLRYVSGFGGIRVSPHYYNTKQDIDRLLNVTETFLKKRSQKRYVNIL